MKQKSNVFYTGKLTLSNTYMEAYNYCELYFLNIYLFTSHKPSVCVCVCACVYLHVGLNWTETERVSGSTRSRKPCAQPTKSSDVAVQQMAVGVSLALVHSLVCVNTCGIGYKFTFCHSLCDW